MNESPLSQLAPAPGADLVPRWRGRLHGAATVAWIPAGTMLVGRATSTRDRLALAVYVVSIASMFAVSAAFHLGRWSPARRATLGRLDHSMIFLAIAGTYTPFSVIAMPQPLGGAVLATVWLGAIAGIALRLVWKDGRPRPGRVILAGPYVALGWVGVVAFPQLVASLGVGGFGLLLLGGIFYTAGAAVYSRRWPDPSPAVFGYHEVFHALVIAGALAQFSAAALHLAPAR